MLVVQIHSLRRTCLRPRHIVQVAKVHPAPSLPMLLVRAQPSSYSGRETNAHPPPASLSDYAPQPILTTSNSSSNPYHSICPSSHSHSGGAPVPPPSSTVSDPKMSLLISLLPFAPAYQKNQVTTHHSTTTHAINIPDSFSMATLFPCCAIRPRRPAEPFIDVPREEKTSDCGGGGVLVGVF